MTITAIFAYLIFIYLAHLIGDWRLQTQWMAENKSKEWLPLLAHVFVYTIAMSVVAIILLGLPGILYAVVNGVLHLATDYISSRISRKAREEGNMNKFWHVVGTDQFTHQICLTLTLLLFI